MENRTRNKELSVQSWRLARNEETVPVKTHALNLLFSQTREKYVQDIRVELCNDAEEAVQTVLRVGHWYWMITVKADKVCVDTRPQFYIMQGRTLPSLDNT